MKWVFQKCLYLATNGAVRANGFSEDMDELMDQSVMQTDLQSRKQNSWKHLAIAVSSYHAFAHSVLGMVHR